MLQTIALGLTLGCTAGCLFSSDTEGLKCSLNKHCQSGQVCADGKCTPASEGTAGVDTDDTDGSGSSGDGSGSGTSS